MRVATMAKPAIVALWQAVAITLALQVSAKQIGQGLGNDNLTFTEAFNSDNFYAFFPHINNPLAHTQGFYDYELFVTAASMFEKEGFGLVGGSTVQTQEIAAFLAHPAHETTCGWSGSVDGPYACYNQELSPSGIYCMDDIRYPCMNDAMYLG